MGQLYVVKIRKERRYWIAIAPPRNIWNKKSCAVPRSSAMDEEGDLPDGIGGCWCGRILARS
jgi:hypothetical protein